MLFTIAFQLSKQITSSSHCVPCCTARSARFTNEVSANHFSIVYNKWHETELERWLSDHNVPYPTPADRKDLENLVKNNWQSKIASPYNDWDTNQLSAYLKQKGVETKDTAAANKDGLLAQVKNYWYETEEKAEDSYSSVKDWIFDRSVILLHCCRLLTNILIAGLVNNQFPLHL